MRILNRKQFFECPAGTVFMNYESCGLFSRLSMKVGPIHHDDVDFLRADVDQNFGMHGATESTRDCGEEMRVLDAAENGARIDLLFDSCGRDGMFEDEQLFAVLDDDDVERMISWLQARKGKQ